ncbi:isopeptide-forming domain-containing fimbrial protein [Ectobacillus polymachus]|uniref:isopeptide-forming domain-containing fimbrial protein n=1 Tax=Ectobacillus polymachus TaxID=1508806 RepID=UPI003A851A77
MKKKASVLMIFLLLLQLFSPGLTSFAASPVKDISHTIQTKEAANLCLREYEGQLKFQWPSNKKKVDLVIVQDASGSFQNTLPNVKKSLKSIVDQLDPQNDRVMVTSFQDYLGFKKMNGSVLDKSGTGIKTTLQSGLNSGLQSAKNGIDKINANSGTPMASGLQFALQQYEQAKGQADPDRETVFLLVTDGVANVQLDGYIYKETNQLTDTGKGYSSLEYGQDYKGALSQVTDQANLIKGKGYKLVTAFWEDKKALSASDQYYTKYDVVGPYAQNALQNMATKPEWFVLSNNIEEFTKKLFDTVTEVTKNDKMVLDFYNDLQVTEFNVSGPNGSTTKPVLKDNQLTWDLARQPAGTYTLTYKVKETKPQPNGFDVAGGYFISSDQRIEIPTTKTSPNPNADQCYNNVSKKVSDADQKLVDAALLNSINEEFQYDINYRLGFDVESKQVIALQDDLEDILDILDTKLTNAKGETIQITPIIDKATSIVTYTLPKQNGSYAYLAGQQYTLTIKAKIKPDTNLDVLKQFIASGGIPNIAKLILDNKPLESNKVTVTPPIEEPKLHKTVSDNDETNVEKATLSSTKEKFTWNVNYEFGNAPGGYNSIVLSDDLENVLDIVDVKVVNKKGENINVQPNIDPTSKKVTVELPKKDGSYAYLAGETYTLHITSKISDQASTEELAKYLSKGGIPNKAELLLNDKSTMSNEVTVVPPIGQIEIEKVDVSDSNIKLKNAVFQILDKDGKEVGKITTDVNGKATLDQLLLGKYTIKEVQAPDGYMLLRDPIEAEITLETPIQKIQVENTKREWTIPSTGGTGTPIFYFGGSIVMLLTLFFYFRKKVAGRF